jgi:hypothetical protein
MGIQESSAGNDDISGRGPELGEGKEKRRQGDKETRR